MEISSITIGRAARQYILQNQTASLAGSTSRGLFLRLENDRVIFLTTERYKSPLTVNLEWLPDPLRALPAGTRCEIHAESLHFRLEDEEVIIKTNCAEDPLLAPARPIQSAAQRHARLVSIAEMFIKRSEGAGLSCCLPFLLEPVAGQISDQHTGLLEDLRGVRNALDELHAERAASLLIKFLGLGRGLTPSGDDLVIGLLLALNRWGKHLRPHLDVGLLNQAVLSQVFVRTTALAASLIECAAHGESDERLVLALDGMLTGEPDESSCARYLAGWGHSSGGDALVGMLLAGV